MEVDQIKTVHEKADENKIKTPLELLKETEIILSKFRSENE